VAFCIGTAAVVGLQSLWLSWIKHRISTQPVMALPAGADEGDPDIDPAQFRARSIPRWIQISARTPGAAPSTSRSTQSISAGRMVPLPGHLPFVPL